MDRIRWLKCEETLFLSTFSDKKLKIGHHRGTTDRRACHGPTVVSTAHGTWKNPTILLLFQDPEQILAIPTNTHIHTEKT